MLPNVAREEAEYALDAAQKDPWNESPWSYFIGVMKEQMHGKNISDAENATLLSYCETTVKNIRQNFKETANPDGEECPNILSTLIELLEIKADYESLSSAAHMANALALVHDRIRQKYWLYREKELRVLIEKVSS